jgi:hypothetical protein
MKSCLFTIVLGMLGSCAEAACPDASGIKLQLMQQKTSFSGEPTSAVLDADQGTICVYRATGEMVMSTRTVPGSKDCQPSGSNKFVCQYGEFVCPGDAEVRAQYSSYTKDWRGTRGDRLTTRFKRIERREDPQGALLRCIYEPGKATIERR